MKQFAAAEPASRLPSISLADDVVFGRDSIEAGCVLRHPTVSKRHARLGRGRQGAPMLSDLGSTNGTFVNARRLKAPWMLREKDEVRIGPYGFVVHRGALVAVHSPETALLRAERLELTTKGKRRLANVSIVFHPGEFTAIIGPSGCGKSSLIRVLSGRSKPDDGRVTWNGIDVHSNFDAIKQYLAFVPQKDTLPDVLTVRQFLTYTARLRLPGLNKQEIANQVGNAIRSMRLVDQTDQPVIKDLSGGQRKRVSLANELIAGPQVMFLDEVTSGLDEATDHEVMGLLRGLADSGITIVCVTHTLANVGEDRDNVLVMARNGIAASHGRAATMPAQFGVRTLGAIYRQLPRGEDDSGNVDQTREEKAWSALYERSDFYGRICEARQDDAAPAAAPPPSHVSRPFLLSQFGLLVARYVETILRDLQTLAFSALQSIIIGVALGLVFFGAGNDATRKYQFLFLLGVSAFWLGCNNSAKEIVKEREFFWLERDVNLRISSYVLSKVAVQGLLGSLEVLLLIVVVRVFGLSFGHPAAMLGILLLALSAGIGCGLLISAVAKGEDAAIALVPIALVPQMLLAAAIVAPLPRLADWLGKSVISAYWVYRAELQLLGAPGIEPGRGWIVIGLHSAAFTVLCYRALWVREQRRRK